VIGLVATIAIGYLTLVSHPQPAKPEQPTGVAGTSAD
jgi:hypothetical protein